MLRKIFFCVCLTLLPFCGKAFERTRFCLETCVPQYCAASAENFQRCADQCRGRHEGLIRGCRNAAHTQGFQDTSLDAQEVTWSDSNEKKAKDHDEEHEADDHHEDGDEDADKKDDAKDPDAEKPDEEKPDDALEAVSERE